MIEFEILFETLHHNLEIAREALAVKRWDNAAIAFEHVAKVAGVAARAVVRAEREKPDAT